MCVKNIQYVSCHILTMTFINLKRKKYHINLERKKIFANLIIKILREITRFKKNIWHDSVFIIKEERIVNAWGKKYENDPE